MEARVRWKGSAVLGGVLALAGGGAVHKCANKVEVLEISGVAGEAPRQLKVTVKAISSQGVSCAAAYKFLALQFKNTTSTVPEGFKCKVGRFKAPAAACPRSARSRAPRSSTPARAADRAQKVRRGDGRLRRVLNDVAVRRRGRLERDLVTG